jgi:DNA polymerase II small subunit/DNA polymerase delta subunit B
MNTPKRSARPAPALPSDAQSIVKDAQKELASPLRRMLGKRILSLGGLMLLSGCDLTNGKSVESMLRKVSSFNDDVQALLFDPHTLAPTYPESMIARPFPFNAYYDIDQVPDVDAVSYRLELNGLVKASAPGASTNCMHCRSKAR